MRKFYHVTSKRNLESIRREGLVPQYGFLSEMAMEEYSAVYLFKELSEVQYAMEHWFRDMIRYMYDLEDLILLEVVLPDHFTVEERFEWEALSRRTIPAEYLTVIDFPQPLIGQEAEPES